MSDKSTLDAATLAEAAEFTPRTYELLPIIFEKYDFSFRGEDMPPHEVFAREGFLPLILNVAVMQISQKFAQAIQVQNLPNEGAIFGMFSNETLIESPSQRMLLIAYATSISKEIFGSIPGPVDLDELYQWAHEPQMQKQGLPVMGRDYN